MINKAEVLNRYIKEVPEITYDLINSIDTPLTVIYPGAKKLAKNVIASDGTTQSPPNTVACRVSSVVVGDRAGKVGLGVGKSRDVQNAINKAYDNGAKQMQSVILDGSTIVHEVRAKFSGSRVMLRPARAGTGIIAGGTVRLIADLAGVHDLVSKRSGSANKMNTARATLSAFSSLMLVKKGAGSKALNKRKVAPVKST